MLGGSGSGSVCVCVCVCDATGETRKGCEAGVRVAAFNVGIDASVI